MDLAARPATHDNAGIRGPDGNVYTRAELQHIAAGNPLNHGSQVQAIAGNQLAPIPQINNTSLGG